MSLRTEWAAEADLFTPARYIRTKRSELVNDRRCALEDLDEAEGAVRIAKLHLASANKVRPGGIFSRRTMQAQAIRALNRARVKLRRATVAALSALDALNAE